MTSTLTQQQIDVRNNPESRAYAGQPVPLPGSSGTRVASASGARPRAGTAQGGPDPLTEFFGRIFGN